MPARYAAGISGVSTTARQIGGAIGVAAFGTLYLSLAPHQGTGLAAHAFAITTAAGLPSAGRQSGPCGYHQVSFTRCQA